MKSHTIVTAADGRYTLQAQVLALSLARTQTTATRLVVQGNDWTTKERDRLVRLGTGNLSVECLAVDDSKFADIRLTNGFPIATAYNILAPRHLFGDLDRLLYVDADVVVRKDLASLFQMDNETGISACLDAHIGWVANPTMWRPWKEESLEPFSPYLNTGVMLIDPPRWNERRLTEETVSYLRKYDLPCVDQDALNLVLRGEFGTLRPAYNSMPYHILSAFRHIDLVTPSDQISEALTDPAIVHFHRSFLGKPWELGCIHPARNLWRTLADEIHPRWRRKVDLVGLGRRKAAAAARMLRMDEQAESLDW